MNINADVGFQKQKLMWMSVAAVRGSRACVNANGARLPSVLVPGLDLCVGQVESRGQVHAVLHAEVFLSLEAPLELVELVVGEGCPGFARLFRAHGGAVPAAGDLPITLLFGSCSSGFRLLLTQGLMETLFTHQHFSFLFFLISFFSQLKT